MKAFTSDKVCFLKENVIEYMKILAGIWDWKHMGNSPRILFENYEYFQDPANGQNNNAKILILIKF